MNNSIRLSDIAKQKALSFVKLKPTQLIIKEEHKQWPNIHRKSNKKKSNNSPNGDNEEIGKSYRFQKNAEDDNKSISSINVSRKEKSNLLKNVGLQTLMNIDISLSEVGQRENSIEINEALQKKHNKKQYHQQDLSRQIAIMKEKLKKIIENEVTIPNYQQYNPLSDHNIKESQDKYLILLKEQIMKDKANKFQKTVFKIYAKKFYREICIVDNLHKLIKKRQMNTTRKYFQCFRKFVEKQGERKTIMEAIKRRLIQKRNDQIKKKQIEKQELLHLSLLQA